MEKLPQRLTGYRNAYLGPLSGALRSACDCLLDLLSGRWRIATVVDAHIHRAVALRAQPRHEASPQDRGLAEARLAEQHRQALALHAPREFSDLFLAAMEVGSRLLGERREPKPRIRGIHRRRGGHGIGLRGGLNRHGARALMNSLSRCAKSGVTRPRSSSVKCSALKRSGTIAFAASVPSIATGSTNSAPSAMLRERSIA